MPLRHDLVGQSWHSGMRRWTFWDTALYALGVGAGSPDPDAERDFTAGDVPGRPAAVLPTFAATLLSRDAQPSLGEDDISELLHTHQSLTLHGALPVDGTSASTSRLKGFYDRGPSALAVIDSTCVEQCTGRPLAELRTGLTVRRAGGFGGDPGPDDGWECPTGDPDHDVEFGTSPGQALLYRLSGDRNPLHSDPAVAARVGLRAPMLHGLCTFGFAGRALLRVLCGGDPARFGTMSARFSAPVYPGQPMRVAVWVGPDEALFQVRTDRAIVMDAGRFTLRGS